MKYRCPLGVLLISQPGGNGVLSSNASLLNGGPRLLCWFWAAFRTAEKDAGEERVRVCETVKPPSLWSGGVSVVLPSSGGCLKKEGGSFRIRIGREFELCSTLTGLITCVNSRSSSFSESCLTCSTTLLFFRSIMCYKRPDCDLETVNSQDTATMHTNSLYLINSLKW